MSCCSPLGEATAAAAEVENMDEITVSAELERAFGENLLGSWQLRWCAFGEFVCEALCIVFKASLRRRLGVA
jgi:hypothetical protein